MSENEADTSRSNSDYERTARSPDTLQVGNYKLSHCCVGRSNPPPDPGQEKGQMLMQIPMPSVSQSVIMSGPPTTVTPPVTHTGLGVCGGWAATVNNA